MVCLFGGAILVAFRNFLPHKNVLKVRARHCLSTPETHQTKMAHFGVLDTTKMVVYPTDAVTSKKILA